MWSSNPVCARPVRTFPRSTFSASTDFCIFCSADFLTSAIMSAPEHVGQNGSTTYSVPKHSHLQRRLAMHQRALVLTHDHPLQCPRRKDAEDLEQHVLITAECECGRVHHFKVLDHRLVEGEAGVALGRRILFRIGGIDAIDLGCLEHDVDAHLASV